MIIRKEQMRAFSADRIAEFERYMLDHVQQTYPQRCAEIGEGGPLVWIRDGIDRAEKYDIAGQRDIARFIDVMFILGRDFDEDGSCSWAERILRDRNVSPTTRVDELCAETTARMSAG